MNPHESLVHRRTIGKQILNFYICKSVWFSEDWIRRFDLWCSWFVTQFSKDLICRFDSWEKNPKKVQFVSNRRGSSTNPATLVKIRETKKKDILKSFLVDCVFLWGFNHFERIFMNVVNNVWVYDKIWIILNIKAEKNISI